jgi:hypothetical protein
MGAHSNNDLENNLEGATPTTNSHMCFGKIRAWQYADNRMKFMRYYFAE